MLQDEAFFFAKINLFMYKIIDVRKTLILTADNRILEKVGIISSQLDLKFI